MIVWIEYVKSVQVLQEKHLTVWEDVAHSVADCEPAA